MSISIDLLSTYYNHKIKGNLLSATKHFTDILFDNVNYFDRLEFFDNLYEIDVIKGGKLKSYYECVSCPPNTFNGVLSINIKPSNLKLKCPSCNKEVLYIVPYELDKTIYDHIVHKDGLLFHAIGYLLNQTGVKHIPNQTFLTDVEIDYCLLDNEKHTQELIEVKMFKTDRPSDTQIGNLRDSVVQMKKAIDKLIEKDLGFKEIKHSIVTNINNKQAYDQVRIEMETILKEYNIEIYTITQFHERFSS
ncbi:MAG: hypothetical protein QE487_16150 [Fluviicola sp.]|nr:hypothetical protein [Fluviicola sp.]